jgi:hypothetical protein
MTTKEARGPKTATIVVRPVRKVALSPLYILGWVCIGVYSVQYHAVTRNGTADRIEERTSPSWRLWRTWNSRQAARKHLAKLRRDGIQVINFRKLGYKGKGGAL